MIPIQPCVRTFLVRGKSGELMVGRQRSMAGAVMAPTSRSIQKAHLQPAPLLANAPPITGPRMQPVPNVAMTLEK